MLQPSPDGKRFELHSPTAMPRAAGFLWNRRMLLQLTCRGYATAQFMQPEPAKYAYAPNLEARTFMQPEQPYYAHHPGRFFYVKDESSGALFSAPYEPVRASLDRFCFSLGKHDIRWSIATDSLELDLSVTLARNDVVELWRLTIRNNSSTPRRLSLYPYFPIGYMSWMNQSAQYRPEFCGIIAACVTPYQKVDDYFRNRNFKEKTFFLASEQPLAWETRQEMFEGEGGLHSPSGIAQTELANGEALYETPAAILQFRLDLPPGGSRDFRFLFGPALDDAEIIRLRDTYLSPAAFSAAAVEYADYIAQGKGCLRIETPDPQLDNFVNEWLPRQLYYHGDVNRLTTDPQTRNYLQDNMGMTYVQPQVARAAFLRAVSQQEPSGAMPDGIILVEGAELKYINRIPHTDHCVWLPVCLQAYFDETNDYDLLRVRVADRAGERRTVFDRVTAAIRWLLQARDHRGLSFIAQGDWCDPMNMVGYKGRGVSSWLSIATAYALNLWAEVCAEQNASELAAQFKAAAAEINNAVNTHLWDGRWFARGITDDGAVFGVSKDPEGRIFLNPQSWAFLSGAADAAQRALMLQAISEQLETPYGPTLLAPPFTAMREDVGRVTQKFPGSAENGSVYNHGAVFHIYGLYRIGEADRAFRVLRQMLPGPGLADYLQRGQLPVFIPNYYRGAWREHPRTAGRSSQLFNTGTVAWLYRCLIECLFGLRGTRQGLLVHPQLPGHWGHAKVTREFRGARINVHFRREPGITETVVLLDGRPLPGNLLTGITSGAIFDLEVKLPPPSAAAGASA